MDNELLRNIIKEAIDYEFIEECVKAKVAEKFDYELSRAIQNKVVEICNDKANKYIRDAVDNVINGSVRVDDGWGNHEEYGSFEDLVKRHISRNIRDKWGIEREIRNAVDAKLKKYIEVVINRKMDDRVETVLEMLADDIKKDTEKKK